MNYLRMSSKYSRVSLIDTFVWTALGTYMVVVKNDIGVDNISIYEMVLSAFAFIGASLALRVMNSPEHLRSLTLWSDFGELIITAGIIIDIIGGYGIAGHLMYTVAALQALISSSKGRSKRALEDMLLTPFQKRWKREFDTSMDIWRRGVAVVGVSTMAASLNVFDIELDTVVLMMCVPMLWSNIYCMWIAYRWHGKA